MIEQHKQFQENEDLINEVNDLIDESSTPHDEVSLSPAQAKVDVKNGVSSMALKSEKLAKIGKASLFRLPVGATYPSSGRPTSIDNAERDRRKVDLNKGMTFKRNSESGLYERVDSKK